MWMHLMPLNCIPKNGYSDLFFMYILLQLKKKKDKSTREEKERRQQQQNSGSWQSVAGRICKPAVGKAENHHDLHHRILQRPSQCCLSGKGDGIHCRMKSVRSGAGSPPPPLSPLLLPQKISRSADIGRFSEKLKSRGRVLSRWSKQTRGKTKRYQGVQLTRLVASSALTSLFYLLRVLDLPCNLLLIITCRQPLVTRCKSKASSRKKIYKEKKHTRNKNPVLINHREKKALKIYKERKHQNFVQENLPDSLNAHHNATNRPILRHMNLQFQNPADKENIL